MNLSTLLQSKMVSTILPVIIVLVIIIAVVIPLFFKLRQKHLKTKETNNIMKDLLTWRHLSDLVRGGKAQSKAKAELSGNLLKIESLLAKGFADAASRGRTLYSVPWYMLVGEPHSGKSALLSESSLELIPSTVEAPGGSADESIPVRLWNGAKAVICDVNGRVFFDRWMEGDSAEWNSIIHYIAKRHKKKPLDGLIITIPADALLSDSDAIAHKKAILMANELGSLFDTCGMYLPCYVVITKIDMIDGFREYAAPLVGDLQHQIFGFKAEEKIYNEEKMREFWDALLEKFRSGFRKLMTSREVSAAINSPDNRVELTGKLYSFCENFNDIYGNLDIYLSALFGENSYGGHRSALFKGVFFTSARDEGISLSRRMSALLGKQADETGIPAKVVNSRPFFVRDLFNRWIFVQNNEADFVFHKKILRNIPYWAACAALVVAGSIWLFSSLFSPAEFSASLRQVTSYYGWLTTELTNDEPFYSPLIVQASSDQASLAWGNPMQGGSTFSRGEFFSDNIDYRDVKLYPPLGYLASGALTTFFHLNLGYSDRAFITNQLYSQMISSPLIQITGKKFVNDAAAVPVDKTLWRVINSFFMLDAYDKALPRNFDSRAVIRYVLPNINHTDFEFLNKYLPRYVSRASFSVDANYFDNEDYYQARSAALSLILNSWKSGEAYSDSTLGKLNRLTAILQDIIQNNDKIDAALQDINNVAAYSDVQLAVYAWKQLSDERESLMGEGRRLFNEVRSELRSHFVFLDWNVNTASDPFSDDMIISALFTNRALKYAAKEYNDLFKRDMKFLQKEESGPSYETAITALESNFSVSLAKRVSELKDAIAPLKSNDFLAQKTGSKKFESLFLVQEQIISLASAIDIPDKASPGTFHANWQQGETAIATAQKNYENYVKKYADNADLSAMITNARIMMQAEVLVNRFTTFNSELNFLDTSPGNIAAIVAHLSPDNNYLGLQATPIGGVNFDQSYDPRVVNSIIKEIASFALLFAPPEKSDAPPPPRFLQNVDSYLYEPEPWRLYLDSYISYWGNFTDACYMPVYTWSEYKHRVYAFKTSAVNSMLQTLYKKSFDVLTQIDDVILEGSLKNEKARNIANINDKLVLLSQFTAAKADQMLLAWGNLPGTAGQAYASIQTMSPADRAAIYMPLYSQDASVDIGWWSDFFQNGISILTQTQDQSLVAEFMRRVPAMRAFPLVKNASFNNALGMSDIRELSSLLTALGVSGGNFTGGINMAPNMFQGQTAQRWANTMYSFTQAVSNPQAPLTWTLSQPPVTLVQTLPKNGRIDAFERFRYVETTVAGKAPQMWNTAGNRNTDLLQGAADDSGLRLRFYITSQDRSPAFEYEFDNKWSIFNLYLTDDAASDSQGGLYLPIYLEDATGKYVYYVTVKFSNPLPDPNEWYAQATWPTFSVANSMISGR